MISDDDLNNAAKLVGDAIKGAGGPMTMLAAIENSRRFIAEIRRQRRYIQEMVDIAAANKLDGYRELGQRAAKAENELDVALETIGRLGVALTTAKAEGARAWRERLMTKLAGEWRGDAAWEIEEAIQRGELDQLTEGDHDRSDGDG